jgi:hypothetical protein
MKQERQKKNDEASLYNVLSAHLRTLVAARSDERLIKEYAELLRYLRSRKETAYSGLFSESMDRQRSRHEHGLQIGDVSDASLERLVSIINSDEISRKDLEKIAIQRFGVPSGSMRSFSNRQMLVAKLLSMIRNEFAHETIGRVARRRETPDR